MKIDGTFAPVTRLDEVVETVMNSNVSVSFNELRLTVHKWMKERGCYVLACDRAVDGGVGVIYVSYWDDTGCRQEIRFDEFSSYTARTKIPTW